MKSRGCFFEWHQRAGQHNAKDDQLSGTHGSTSHGILKNDHDKIQGAGPCKPTNENGRTKKNPKKNTLRICSHLCPFIYLFFKEEA